MVVGLTTTRIAPRYVVDANLVTPAEALIADESVNSGIRRKTANFLDDLHRALAIRRTFSGR